MIDGSPEVMSFTINPDEHFIQVPSPLRIRTMMNATLSNLCGKYRTKPVPPETNGFMADIYAPLVEYIFDLPQRQGETDIHHHCQANDLR